MNVKHSCLNVLFDLDLSNMVEPLGGLQSGWSLVSSGIVHIKYLVCLSNIFDTDLVYWIGSLMDWRRKDYASQPQLFLRKIFSILIIYLVFSSGTVLFILLIYFKSLPAERIFMVLASDKCLYSTVYVHTHPPRFCHSFKIVYTLIHSFNACNIHTYPMHVLCRN